MAVRRRKGKKNQVSKLVKKELMIVHIYKHYPNVRRLTAGFVVFMIVMGLIRAGIIGKGLYALAHFLFGGFYWLFLVLISIDLIHYTWKGKWIPYSKELLAVLGMFFGLLIYFSAPMNHAIKGAAVINSFQKCFGGLIGALLYGLFSLLFDFVGTAALSAIMGLAGVSVFIFDLYDRYGYLLFEGEEEDMIEIPTISDVKDITAQIIKDKKIEIPEIKISTEKKTKKKDETKKKEEVENKPVKQKINIFDYFDIDEDEEDDDYIEPTKEHKKKEKTPPIISEPLNGDPKKKNQTRVREDYDDYQFPTIDLLNPPAKKSNGDESNEFAIENGRKLIQVLKEFGVDAIVNNISIGPSIIKYELKLLAAGVSVNRIKNLQNDIQMALATKDVRIEAPIPGKSAIGIEMPNATKTTVTFREVMEGMPAVTEDNKLLIPLGKNVLGKLELMKLNEMPHLLIAGATGSGKSVCVNTIICSLLMRTRPDEVKLLLVDPKKVELSNYNHIAHLLCPVVTDPKKASRALHTVVEEMERRYELFSKYNVRNMAGYNKKIRELKKQDEDLMDDIIPYIVVILDEVADLMMVAGKDVEANIVRLAQMARAAGIHMIIATQRPSTDVITGLIKANVPSRIAFAVSSSIDSRTILDASGAEKLLGRGDMLFNPMGASSPSRVQGAYIADEEVNEIVGFVLKQKDEDYNEMFTSPSGDSAATYSDDEDEEYEDCREFVIKNQKASASMLQRQFRIGYNKAARIMDQLEANGVIGPQEGSKPREVLIRSFNEED